MGAVGREWREHRVQGWANAGRETWDEQGGLGQEQAQGRLCSWPSHGRQRQHQQQQCWELPMLREQNTWHAAKEMRSGAQDTAAQGGLAAYTQPATHLCALQRAGPCALWEPLQHRIRARGSDSLTSHAWCPVASLPLLPEIHAYQQHVLYNPCTTHASARAWIPGRHTLHLLACPAHHPSPTTHPPSHATPEPTATARLAPTTPHQTNCHCPPGRTHPTSHTTHRPTHTRTIAWSQPDHTKLIATAR